MTNTGIPANAGQTYDAIMFKGENSNVVYDDQFQNGSAVQAKAPGMVLMDTKTLPIGSITGLNNLFINWKCSNTDDVTLRVEIRAGEEEEGWDIAFQCEDASFNFGNEIIYDFDPYKTYRIIISSLTSEEVFLDYIQLTPIFPGTIVSGIRDVLYGSEVMRVMDFGQGTITGNGTSAVSASVPFNVAFDEPPHVYASCHNTVLKADPTSIGLNGFTLTVRHVDNTNWSTAQNVTWMAVGLVMLPFSPGIP